MNYRHGFHAGNHTEVFKHAALVAVIELLKGKDRPFMVLDSHAGVGQHDLHADMAVRTGEANDGIRRVIDSNAAALQPYLSLVRAFGGPQVSTYPGSPEIVRQLLRDRDRLVACELHPVDAVALRRNMGGDARVALHHRDGYETVLALVPPRERRGLVFIDPPFEDADEAAKLARCLLDAHRKWAQGSYAAWLPIKDFRIADALTRAVRGARVPKALLSTFLRHPVDGIVLAGSGLLMLNPPWRSKERIEDICAGIGACYPGSRWSVEWLTEEDGAPTPLRNPDERGAS